MHSLEMHAMDLCNTAKEMHARGDHQALTKYLMGDRLPCYRKPASKKTRRHWSLMAGENWKWSGNNSMLNVWLMLNNSCMFVRWNN
jgi:hypothetical protein